MASQTPADYGIPHRPPTASTPLWTHLLRPSTQGSTSQPDISNMVPPAKPLDKNATSMRILLHDTQAHFEKFTVHAEKLLDSVKETRQEIKAVKDLFERDRETLVGDIIDLVNRAQTEIQKAIGSPAPTSLVEDAFKDMKHRLSGMEQRLDALQAFNQSHTQALQTQIQATQILLDKQGSILSTLAPLLPLLQAIPLHVDSLKAYIQEKLTSRAVTALSPNAPPNIGSRASAYTHGSEAPSTNKRKRHDATTTPSASKADAPLKRRRTETAPSPSPSPRSRSHPHISPLSTRKHHLQNPEGPPSIRGHPSISSSVASGISPTSNTSHISAMRKNQGHHPQPQPQHHTTPRRPLMDLLLPLPVHPRQETPQNHDHRTPRRPSHDTRILASVSRTTVSSSKMESTLLRGPGVSPALTTGGVARAPLAASDSVVDGAPSVPFDPHSHGEGARPPRILRTQTSFANRNGTKQIPLPPLTGLQSVGGSSVPSGLGTKVEPEANLYVDDRGSIIPPSVPQSVPSSRTREKTRRGGNMDSPATAMNSKLTAPTTTMATTGVKDRIFKLPGPNFGQKPGAGLPSYSYSMSSSSLISSKALPPRASFISNSTSTSAAAVAASSNAPMDSFHGRGQGALLTQYPGPPKGKEAPLDAVLDKTRQTPVREAGRRFIALVDSDDEDDDE